MEARVMSNTETTPAADVHPKDGTGDTAGTSPVVGAPNFVHDEDPSTLDSGAAIPVAVEYVDSQLNELWRDVAEAAQARGGTQAVTTAQVLNLIVRATSYKSANGYVEAIERITGRHPCRVLVATTDPE